MESVFWQKYLLPLIQNPLLAVMPLHRAQKWEAEAIRSISAAWDTETDEKSGYEFIMRSALSDLIYNLYSHIPSGSSLLPRRALLESERIKLMLCYIQDHFSEDLTLEEIAESASVSKSECLRCFKSIVKTSPCSYVRQYRLQKAAEMLDSSCMKIIDVAEACGFREMSYFAKVFCGFKGMTPSEYRKRR